MSMNVGIFSGNIGSVNDLRYTPDGKQILGFSLAVQEGYGDNKKTLWVRCSLSGKRAESLSTMLQKGTKATVSGRVGVEKWEGKNGKPGGAAITMWVNEIDFYGRGEREPAPAKEDAKPANPTNNDEDLPF